METLTSVALPVAAGLWFAAVNARVIPAPPGFWEAVDRAFPWLNPPPAAR